MRIAFFTDTFYPELSGVADAIATLTGELGRRGHTVRIFAPRYARRNYELVGRTGALDPDLGENADVARFASFPYPTATGQGRMVIPTGFRALRIRAFRPDVLHSHLFFGVGLEGLFASRILGRPLVGTNHTAIKELLRFSPVRAQWVDERVLRYVSWYYNRCVFTSVPSQSVIHEMRFYGFRGASRILPNPIDTATFHPLPRRELLKKKLGFPTPTVIHAGRFAAERNVDVILQAVALVRKRIPALTLALAGKGQGEAELKALARELGIAKAVRFLGFLEHGALADAYNASELFVITSTSDTQSLVMMQAMACGLPVVGVRARGLPDYITRENGYLVEPNDPRALAEKIIFLVTHKGARERLGRGALRVTRQFGVESIANEWHGIYEKAVRGAAPHEEARSA